MNKYDKEEYNVIEEIIPAFSTKEAISIRMRHQQVKL